MDDQISGRPGLTEITRTDVLHGTNIFLLPKPATSLTHVSPKLPLTQDETHQHTKSYETGTVHCQTTTLSNQTTVLLSQATTLLSRVQLRHVTVAPVVAHDDLDNALRTNHVSFRTSGSIILLVRLDHILQDIPNVTAPDPGLDSERNRTQDIIEVRGQLKYQIQDRNGWICHISRMTVPYRNMRIVPVNGILQLN